MRLAIIPFAHRPPNRAAALLSALVLWQAVAATSLSAAERTWKLERFSGEVTVTDPAGKPYTIGPGFLVRPGDRIMTGANGRVMISRGGDSIVMSLNAMVEIPVNEKEGETPSVIQRRGSATFEIEKQASPHFMVETPQLGAVVKGTHFTVDVQDATSDVAVTEGVVQVVDFASGDSADIRVRQSAGSSTPGRTGLRLDGETPLPIIRQGAPRMPVQATRTATQEPAIPSGTVAGSKLSAAGAANASEPTPRTRFLSLNYYLNDAGAADVILALVILGSIGTGILVWIALSIWSAMRRKSEIVPRAPRREP